MNIESCANAIPGVNVAARATWMDPSFSYYSVAGIIVVDPIVPTSAVPLVLCNIRSFTGLNVDPDKVGAHNERFLCSSMSRCMRLDDVNIRA